LIIGEVAIMYINFWYAMELGKNVTADKPLKIRRLNQNFVLFRDAAGAVQCLHDVCSHRGGSLGAGRIRDGHIECPYHGWQFNGGGDCVYIPSLGADNQKIPARTKIDSYPVQEKYGLVFAFLGDLPPAQRPPLMCPDSNPQGYAYPPQQWRWVAMSWPIKANYERCVENGIDPSHNEFVHRAHGFMGNRQETYKVNQLDPVEHEWGGGFWHRFYAPPSTADVLYKGETARDKEGDLNVSAGHSGPNQVWTYIHITGENWIHQYLYETPVDAINTVAFNISISNFLPEDVATDEEIMEMNASVAVEDVQVLEDITPMVTPDNMISEVMMPSDKAIVDYRRCLKQWDARGWRIDSQALKRDEHTKAYAIPSPRRRSEKGWVFDSVPLLSATTAAVKKAG
jgi:phenylpropionate dioxygenase-like ring-hydroxylating dioxygenase large terminal subunit